METKEVGCETTWCPDKETLKADMLCRIRLAGQELQKGLEWDDPGLKNGAIEDFKEVLEDIRHNLTITFNGKDKLVEKASKELTAFASEVNGRKAAKGLIHFHKQVLKILDRW